jgi:hypothetical protein
MREEVGETTTRAHWRMQRVIGVMTVLFWASVGLVGVLVGLSCATNGSSTSWAARCWW